MGLETYREKRDFDQTPEPRPRIENSAQQRFVVQEHHASRLHFDFRLEMGGVLKSWAIPKGPSMNSSDKRLAMQVEDHPVDYIRFGGEIAEGNYGAGQVRVWDIGTYDIVGATDPLQGYAEGKLSFMLNGAKLRGQFNLLRMRGRGRDNQWLLIKSADKYAVSGWKLETILPVTEPAGAAKRERTMTRRAAKKDRASKSPPRRGKSRTPKADGPLMSLAEFAQSENLERSVQVNVDGVVVQLSHLDKLYWPRDGITKGELLKYYANIAPLLLPYLIGRPLILKRYPNGVDAAFFFQHDLIGAPEYVHTRVLESEQDRAVEYAIIDNTATLLYLTNLGTIEEHPWHSRVDDIGHPNWLVLDLDPEDAPFDVVVEVAQAVHGVLSDLGLAAYAKTSGSRGIHIYVPIEPLYKYAQVAELAEQIAVRTAQENPQSATVVRSLSRRKAGLVYVDHLQNARGKSVAAPYSVRARPSATVSAPLDWRDVNKGLSPKQFTLGTMLARVKDKGDLFAAVLDRPQSLDRAIEATVEISDKRGRKRSGAEHPRAQA